MESNIAFMHSESTPFFVPKLPFGSLLPVQKKKVEVGFSYSGGGGDGLMWSYGSFGTFGFFFHNSIQASMLAPIEI